MPCSDEKGNWGSGVFLKSLFLISDLSSLPGAADAWGSGLVVSTKDLGFTSVDAMLAVGVGSPLREVEDAPVLGGNFCLHSIS